MAAELVEDLGPLEGAGVRAGLRPVVAGVVSRPVGPELMAGLLELAGRDLSARELVEVTVAWKNLVGFATAAQLTAISDLDRAMSPPEPAGRTTGRAGCVPAGRAAADELAPALRIAPATASRLVVLARRAEQSLPAALDALADGRLDLAQLKVVDEVTRDLPAGTRVAVEAAAVRWGPARTPRQLRAELDAEAARRDPAHAASRAGRGVAERDVTLRPSPLPGCRRLVADLPTLEATAAWLAVNGAAVAAKDRGLRPDGAAEDRCLGQLRADQLAALLTGQGDPGALAVPTREQLASLAEVQVVVAADTLTGAGTLPAHVPGVGPLDTTTARRLAGLAGLRRLVAAPDTGTLVHADRHVLPASGQDGATTERRSDRLARLLSAPVQTTPLDLGLTRYRPTPAQRLHVHVRDATCIGPAHWHPARGTELDHTVDYRRRDHTGRLGTTSHTNLGSACKRIHNAKTHGGWQLTQPTPGTFVWTSPTGRLYLRRAQPLLPGWQRERRPPPPDPP
ncbi:MAG: DUF222 domain-containing protein [Actinomycetes bacterium]